MKPCLFCQLRPGTTVEHLFSQAWLKRVMHSERYDYQLVRNEQGDLRGSNYNRPTPEIEAAGFCQRCNNGWMDALDKRIEPLLTTMIRGQARALDSPTAATLATWSCKIAMVADTMQGTAALSQGHRDYLFDHGEPPPGWRIWLASTCAVEGHRIVVAPVTLVRPGGLGYVFTAALDRFVVQALVLPNDEAPDMHPYEPSIVQCLWPLNASRRRQPTWPLGTPLSEQDLEYFTIWPGAAGPVKMHDPPPAIPLTP
jgi:hypothetical protein